mgnify:CR=1 FL=1
MDGGTHDAQNGAVDPDFLHSCAHGDVDMPELNPTSRARFFNRELSWLNFNWRVLQEAQNPRLPTLERVKMLSISGTNLDEFYTVRVAGLREMVRNGIETPALDGLTPREQLRRIDTVARDLMRTQQKVWVALI